MQTPHIIEVKKWEKQDVWSPVMLKSVNWKQHARARWLGWFVRENVQEIWSEQLTLNLYFTIKGPNDAKQTFSQSFDGI